MWPFPGSFSNFHTFVDIGGIRTRIVGLEGEHTDHFTTTMTLVKCCFYFRYRTTGSETLRRSFRVGIRDSASKFVSAPACIGNISKKFSRTKHSASSKWSRKMDLSIDWNLFSSFCFNHFFLWNWRSDFCVLDC